ncbi:hypothetical protein PsorP6_005710 [Peronosclerospora sorghi]|uniref:Uncharacterized protein n=1 Tax=Peronosclerospora sorghi TaxID=230839 RepID=A0ACC0W5M1_9STRA|nr:hypothetical protein PsorP6_005710 [Peronosclerospora sorghi]
MMSLEQVPGVVIQLVQDLRRFMAPYTADKLREKRKNTLKDFVHVGAPLGVTHFLFFTTTETSTNLKIARVPRGPTLSFQATKYSLMRRMHLVVRRPVDTSQTSGSVPLRGRDGHGGIPSVRDPGGPPRALEKCENPIKAKIPNLHKLEDISEYVLDNGAGVVSASDSEVDDETAHVTLPDAFRDRGNHKAEKSAVRLTEIGPRLTLRLTKVERGICEGDVLYHAYKTKTPEEAAKAKAKHEAAVVLKRERREVQEANVLKKQQAKEAKKLRKVERKRKSEQGNEDPDDVEEAAVKTEGSEDESELDDGDYYRQEVGEEPGADMFLDIEKHKRVEKQAGAGKKPSEIAASDQTHRFVRPGNKAPKDQIVRQRKPKN